MFDSTIVDFTTRHSNVECFESAVPAIFLSYAPTFYAILLWQFYRLHMSEELFNSSMTIVSSSIKRKTTNQRNQMNPLHCLVHVSTKM